MPQFRRACEIPTLDKCGVGCASEGDRLPRISILLCVRRIAWGRELRSRTWSQKLMISDAKGARAYIHALRQSLCSTLIRLKSVQKKSLMVVHTICGKELMHGHHLRKLEHIQLPLRVSQQNSKYEYSGSIGGGDKLVLIINRHATQCLITASPRAPLPTFTCTLAASS